jgi:hypothetical protein
MNPGTVLRTRRRGQPCRQRAGRAQAIRFRVEDSRQIAGSAHPFNEARLRGLIERDYDRARSFASVTNHTMLKCGEVWKWPAARDPSPFSRHPRPGGSYIFDRARGPYRCSELPCPCGRIGEPLIQPSRGWVAIVNFPQYAEPIHVSVSAAKTPEFWISRIEN